MYRPNLRVNIGIHEKSKSMQLPVNVTSLANVCNAFIFLLTEVWGRAQII